MAYYDNLKYIPPWLSDESCRAATGIGQTKRKLFTDEDDIVFEYKRCLGFNGINLPLTEGDALDRSIMIELDRIADEYKKLEEEIISQFMELRPRLLGYIFNILVRALQIKPTLNLNRLPRMADFSLWCEAISRAMGNQDMKFLEAYYQNIGRQNMEAIENHPLGQAIVKLFDSIEGEELEGSPKHVLETLETVAIDNKIDINHRLWPKAANSLPKRLKQVSSNLLEGFGILVTVTRTNKDGNGKVNMSSIKIRKKPPEPPEPPKDQNHEGNLHQNIGGSKTIGDSILPTNAEPPIITTENYAQNPDIGGIGGFSDKKQAEEGSVSDISSEIMIKHVDIFWQTFDDLEELDSGIVEHKQLQDMLISTGKFFAGDAHYSIEQMVKSGQIVEVDFHRYKRKEGGSAKK